MYRWSTAEERIWIDIGTFPIALWIGDGGDGEVEMVVARAGVSGVADVGNHLSLAHVFSLDDSGSVAREVSVVEDKFLVWTKLIDRGSAALALEEFQNATIGCGQHRSSTGRHNIDGIVQSPFRSCVAKRVEQLLRFDARNGNDQVYCSDEIRDRRGRGRRQFFRGRCDWVS